MVEKDTIKDEERQKRRKRVGIYDLIRLFITLYYFIVLCVKIKEEMLGKS